MVTVKVQEAVIIGEKAILYFTGYLNLRGTLSHLEAQETRFSLVPC